MRRIVRLLMSFGIQIDARDPEDGSTALYGALTMNFEDNAKVMIDCGASVDVGIWTKSEEACGETPLHYAAVENSYEIFQYMMKTPMNINVRNCEGSTPLHEIAAYHMNITHAMERITLLIRHGADIDARDLVNYTPLTYASMKMNASLDVIRRLIDLGADPRARVGIEPCMPLSEKIVASENGNLAEYVVEYFQHFL